MQQIHIEPVTFDARCEALRAEVRRFVAAELRDYPPVGRARNWSACEPDFARKVGAQGWIGLTWPREYGGQERTQLERYVVWEELLAAGAPVASCLPLDRQTGPLLIEYGSERIKQDLLPRMVRGELTFCVGMSEPDSGSDLASIRSRAGRTAGGWVLNGRKVWTSSAHKADFMVGLFRTSPLGERKHEGLSQFVIDMRTPGIEVRPIIDMQGERHFNECLFDNVELPDYALVGREGDGWRQVTRELAFERSGPERILSSTQLLIEMVDAASVTDARQAVEIGKLVAEMIALRSMSMGIAGMLQRHEPAGFAAALVKDRGTDFEQRVPNVAHELFGVPLIGQGDSLIDVMRFAAQASFQYSIRGGTREILRGIIAKGMESA